MKGRNVREQMEERERRMLAQYATLSSVNVRRQREEEPCSVRTAFQHDCHRIVHCKAFRRLRGKTQVFLWPQGDHYRTRLTHCMEVSQIARTLARALNLNEDLVEAIALAHDLGHTPFGHAGEATMQRLVPGGFRHERQSLRVVEKLENSGRGLNLTDVVRDGILHHSKGAGPVLDVADRELPSTLEGQLVRLADSIAYVNHDLDDALRAKVLKPMDVPKTTIEHLGETHSERITNLVINIIENSNLEKRHKIEMSDESAKALEELRRFLYDNVYYNESVHAEFKKAEKVLERLWEYFTDNIDRFYSVHWTSALKDGNPADDIRDFLAGMTDAFAISVHEDIFTPRRWYVF